MRPINSAGGPVSLVANNGVTLSGADADVTTGGATFTVDADADDDGIGTYSSDDADSLVSTTGGAVSVTAADVELTGAVEAAAGTVSFLPTNGGSVDLGASGGAGQLVLTDSELDLVTTTSKISVGSASAGNVTFTGPVDLAGADTLEIISGGTVNDSGASTVFTDTNLAIDAAGGVGTTSPLNIAVTNFEADGGTGGVNVANTGDLTLGNVAQSSIDAVDASGAEITITAASSITQLAPVNSGGGNVSLNATENVTLSGAAADVTTGGGSFTAVADSDHNGSGTFTSDDAGSAVATSGGDVSITAADIDLSGTMAAAAGTVSFLPSTIGRTVDLGTTGGSGQLVLTSDELDLVTTTSKISVGSATAGDVFVKSAISLANADTLEIISGGDITQDFAGNAVSGDTLIVAGDLAPARTATGTFTVDGAVTFDSTGSFEVKLNGPSDHDQLVVAGGSRVTSLGGAELVVTLDTVPVVGSQEVFTIIDSSDAGSSVTGMFTAGATPLSNGDKFNVGSSIFRINYLSGGDVTLTEAGNTAPTEAANTGITVNEGSTNVIAQANLEFTDTEQAAGDLTYTLDTVPANGTLWIDADNSGTINNVEAALLVGGTFTQADIDANRLSYVHDGSDTLLDSFQFDLSDGIASVDDQTFDITVTPADTEITLVGGNTLTITDVGNSGDSNDALLISYAGGTYTITDTGGLLIDASSIAGAIGSGTDTVTVPDTLVSSILFDTLGGNDSVTVSSLPTLAGDLTIFGGTDLDTVNLDSPVSVTGSVTITAGQVNQGVGASITAGTTVDLTASGPLTIDQ